MQALGEADVLPAHERAERRDAVESRQRILEEARRLFDEHGVETVSMHAIAHAAGVGQGTLYRRYTNKGDLCFDLIKESAESLRVDVEALLQREADRPAISRLDGVLERVIAFTEEKVPMMGAIRDAYCGQNRPMQFSNPYYSWMHGCVAALVSEAVERGEIAALDPVFTADALLATVSPQLYEFQRRGRGMSPEEILAGVRRLFIAGLR